MKRTRYSILLASLAAVINLHTACTIREVDKSATTPVPIDEAGTNRFLSELVSIARRDIPEPANLSAADRAFINRYRAEKGIR